jgi:hypothetical protein
MKKVRLEVEQKEINKLVGKEFEHFLHDDADVIDAIVEVDKLIREKGDFPKLEYINRDDTKVRLYQSLLHILYNPLENRMYDHIIMAAYSKLKPWINVKYEPKAELPDETTVRIILKNICGDVIQENIVDYEILQQMMLEEGYRTK